MGEASEPPACEEVELFPLGCEDEAELVCPVCEGDAKLPLVSSVRGDEAVLAPELAAGVDWCDAGSELEAVPGCCVLMAGRGV